MKYTTTPAFDKYLQGLTPSNFPGVCLFICKDEFLLKTLLHKLLLHRFPNGIEEEKMAIKSLEGRSGLSETLEEELFSPSLFARNPLLVIESADKLGKTELMLLEKYLKAPVTDTKIVFTTTQMSSASALYKQINQMGLLVDMAEETPKEKAARLQEWLQKQLKKEQKTMKPQVAQQLVQWCASEGFQLESEFEKLICLIGDREEITQADLLATTPQLQQDTIWQLAEAIFKRDAPTALRGVRQQLTQGTSFVSLLLQIRRQVQTEYQVCSLLASGASTNAITAQFPYMRGYVLDLHVKQARHYGLAAFKRAMEKIDRAELLTRMNCADLEEPLAEMLVAYLTEP